MATLQKLQIAGIRSYSEDQCQKLKFTTPLTLILGQNGSGKTTIIEAIKYAMTANIPDGTNSGKGFLNDPQMSSKTCTKGQIKLRLVDSKNNAVTVFRTMEVNQTPHKSLKFSSLPGTIQIVMADGDDSKISGSSADITNEFCQIMDVSSSILNNVIFCHQENAAWPLAKGKRVKKKIDQIFNTEHSNKFVKIYREAVKDKQGRIKLLKLEVERRKQKKEQVEKAKQNLQDKEDKLKSIDTEIDTKTAKLELVKKGLEENRKVEKIIEEAERDLAAKEATRISLVAELRSIRKNLPFEFYGNDNELQAKIRSFENDRQEDEIVVADLLRAQNHIETESKEINEAIQKLQIDLGCLNEQKNYYLEKSQERRQLLAQAVDKFDVTISNFEDDKGAIQALIQLTSALRDRQASLDALIEEKELDLEVFQLSIDDFQGQVIETQQTISSKTREMIECEQKIASNSFELNTMSSSEGFLEDLDYRFLAIDETIFDSGNTFCEQEEIQKIESQRSEITTLEHNLNILEREYMFFLQNDIIEGKIECERRLILVKLREINRIKSKHLESLKVLFGSLPETNLKDSVLTKQKTADLTLKTLTEQLNKKQKEVTTLEVQFQNQIEKFNLCQEELTLNQEKISQVCNGCDFNEVLERCFQKRERLQFDKGNYNSIKIIYAQYLKQFKEEKPCCPVCETNFSDKTYVDKIKTTLQNKLHEVPQLLSKVEVDLQEEEALYNKLQQLKVVNDEIRVLSKEKLPQLEANLNEIKCNLEAKKSELDTLNRMTCEPLKILEISKIVISDVSILDQNQADVDKSRNTIEKLERELAQVPSNKSKQETKAEIDSIKLQLNELRRKIDTETKNIYSHKDRILYLTQERNQLYEKQLRMKNWPNLEAQKREMYAKLQSLRNEIEVKKSELYCLERHLGNTVANKNLQDQENKKLIEKKRNELSTFTTLVQDVEKLHREIENYLSNEVEEKLVQIEDNLREFRQKDVYLAEFKPEISEMISAKKDRLCKSELRLRRLQSNVTFREKQAIEVDLNARIEDLKTLIGGYNCVYINEEKSQLIREKENYEKSINSLKGEKNALLENIEELRLQLTTPDTANAHNDYRTKLYELKVVESIVDDLIKNITVLEESILDFHATKMKQVNDTIKKMWRDIYRGNDIDYIEIKARHVSSASATQKHINKYSVVQVKQGVELKMRGRCSAGQKALACLIIRMALAETLSENCGILALDEPTTNLDRENTNSLCEALTRIVESRQEENNFQLVVVTHDEEFINTLMRAQAVPFFYRVAMDQNGFSLIKKEYAL
ncbi:DNA repair protein RAD50-like [Tribolium madens]|uniref:DNA repair protein RAD50-like n=1 Tax=Tribolium madens TaxID=41895 RepID=UPI001CF74DD4|nr:DNA repair protein RAD50-like [Tribolium madens]